jgi:hypothetical protein
MKRFSQSLHFKAQKDCDHCEGKGFVETLVPVFNVNTMDFDIKTESTCRYCLEQSKQDFESYQEDNQRGKHD